MNAENDDAAWAKAHQACFEVAPLIEMRGSQKIQIGFTVDLHARLPMEKAPGVERREESQRILERLRAMVSALAPAEGGRGRLEIEPTRAAASLRAENEMEPEVSVRARVFHADDYFAAVTEEERTQMTAVHKKLQAMGLKQGHW